MMAREPRIDLLFTDVVMPGGMNGREVAEEARLIDPRLKVLFTSGYFEGALLRNGNLDANVQLLIKPYRKKELAQKVQDALKKEPKDRNPKEKEAIKDYFRDKATGLITGVQPVHFRPDAKVVIDDRIATGNLEKLPVQTRIRLGGASATPAVEASR